MYLKFTRPDGTDCYSGTIHYVVGQTVAAPDWNPVQKCGGGLHFGGPKGLLALQNFPGRVLEVEPVGEFINVDSDRKKAESLMVVSELDFQKIMSDISDSEDEALQFTVARNPYVDKEILSKLSKSRFWMVRAEVAENANTDEETLVLLAEDTDYIVKIGARRNPNFKNKNS